MTALIACLFYEGGFYLGRYQYRHFAKLKDAPVGSMAGSIVGLLAFMLAFSFGMAASHFDARKQAVSAEANAVRSAYALADLFPESHRINIQKLLREYVNIRLEAVAQPNKINDLVIRSNQIHNLLWAEAMACEKLNPSVGSAWVFTSKVDEVINMHYNRMAVGAKVRIPPAIWLVLYVILMLSMTTSGFNAGLHGERGSFAFILLCIAFSLVLILINDLDRPQQGFFEVSQQPMEALQKQMNVDKM